MWTLRGQKLPYVGQVLSRDNCGQSARSSAAFLFLVGTSQRFAVISWIFSDSSSEYVIFHQRYLCSTRAHISSWEGGPGTRSFEGDWRGVTP